MRLLHSYKSKILPLYSCIQTLIFLSGCGAKCFELVAKCASPRNLTWFTRSFFFVGGLHGSSHETTLIFYKMKMSSGIRGTTFKLELYHYVVKVSHLTAFLASPSNFRPADEARYIGQNILSTVGYSV